MYIRALLVLFTLAAHGQMMAQTWQTATELSGVDFAKLPATQKAAALKLLREQDCNCGCNLKIAECRVKDPKCSYSQGLGNAVANELRSGKTADQAYAKLRELQKQGPERPRILEAAVPISTAGDPSFGPETAKVTIVEFSDFQCPYCAVAAPKAMAIASQFPKDVRLVFKQFPLDFHSNAFRAAEAALAAHAQGKFWQLHDKMFANYRQLTPENILRWAEEAGLNMPPFQSALQSGKYKSMIEREAQEGTTAGVMGTPTFFINGKRYNGPLEPSTLNPIIQAEIAAAK